MVGWWGGGVVGVGCGGVVVGLVVWYGCDVVGSVVGEGCGGVIGGRLWWWDG